MQTHLTAHLIALVFAFTPLTAMQNPTSAQPPTSPSQSPRPEGRSSEGLVTLEGCLVHDTDVDAHVPKIREPFGVSNEYVLTRAKVIKGSAPESLTNSYDVDDLDPGLLASHVGQRVEIDGWFDHVDRAANPSALGGPRRHLVEIRGNAIRTIAKECQE